MEVVVGEGEGKTECSQHQNAAKSITRLHDTKVLTLFRDEHLLVDQSCLLYAGMHTGKERSFLFRVMKCSVDRALFPFSSFSPSSSESAV